MTSSEIRQSFLDFFREKQHTIVPSSSLLPDAPNLLFTNAGMNQFVPIFLGQAPCPYRPARAADTQKCIRAGGKHNDLEDVGFDTYHHTFFEMLGNWSFGDYFKKEAIAWAWELVVGRWKFPASRIYATVYMPGEGDPASFDQEAHDHWAAIFTAAGLDPAVHIVNGNKKDNFWMMGDTGPCGPCSELHVDLTPGAPELDLARQKEGRMLVNSGDARCIEIWNLVFIQFNANPDGTYVELPAKHVDTGMGFERVTSMIQGTKGFTDLSQNVKISNYETDVFRPLFDELEKITGKTYKSTLPASAQNLSEQEKFDVAFRVIADHIRTLGFSIADGIRPSNEGRGYVLRRILRRAVRYGGNLGLREPFLGKLVDVLGATMGRVFPEVLTKAAEIKKTLQQEEESFLRTLETGIQLFDRYVAEWTRLIEIVPVIRIQTHALRYPLDEPDLLSRASKISQLVKDARLNALASLYFDARQFAIGQGMMEALDQAVPFASFISVCRNLHQDLNNLRAVHNPAGENFLRIVPQLQSRLDEIESGGSKLENSHVLPGLVAFKLYDTYGFPLDLTELMARERGIGIDTVEFELLMEEQRHRSQTAQKKSVISAVFADEEGHVKTMFDGYDRTEIETKVIAASEPLNPNSQSPSFVASEVTPFYVEMGGQVGDVGEIIFDGRSLPVIAVERSKNAVLHYTTERTADLFDKEILLRIDIIRRARIEAHHSGTHLLNWALRKVLGNSITQKGSYVGPDRLRFDFSHGAAVTREQLDEIEQLVNDKIDADVPVKWEERPYAEVKGDPSILQFFGDKYGDVVRVVSIGDFSRELCGGTHVRNSGRVGHLKILSEGAIAAGIRRIEAASGVALVDHVRHHLPKQEEVHSALRLRKTDLAPMKEYFGEETPQAFWRHWEQREAFLRQAAAEVAQHEKDEAKRQEAGFQKRAAIDAPELIAAARTVHDVPFLACQIEAPAAYLPVLADALKQRWQGVAVLAAADQGKVALLASVAPSYTKKVQAGRIIQAIAPLVGGKGGGRPELAQGGGTNPDGLIAALAKAEELL